MSKKIIGVTVGTTVNPKKIGGATSYETLETENKTIVGAINELNNNIDNIAVPEALSELTDDATHRVVTDAEKSAWNAKADVSDIPTKISAFENDKEYATHSYVGQKILEASLNDKEVDLSSYYTREEVDDLIPTVPEWAQSETKPTYTADEVGALPNTTTIPTVPTKISAFENDAKYLTSYTEADPTVPSWAKQSTKPTYTAQEVGALPADTVIPEVPTKISAFENDKKYLTSYTETDPTVPAWAKADTKPTYTASEVGALPDTTVIPTVPTKISVFENDAKYLTSYTETDPTVPAWAKEPTKPSYTASEVGALPSDTEIPTVPTKVSAFENDAKYLTSYTETDPTVPSWAKEATKPTYTANEVGADPSGTANLAIGTHNTSASAHNDIRVLVDNLTTRFNALADSDDTTLDQLSEIVEYIKANKTLIEQVTTNKVNVSDIINNLTTNVNNKPLSAAQGVVLKGLIDAIKVPTKVSELTNDSGFLTTIPSEYVTETELNAKKYLTSYTETDPTVPDWAKASTKPSYTKSEVGLGNVDNVKQYSASNPPPYPVTKVNNKTGEVSLSASDVGADASGTANSVVAAHNTNTSAHADIRTAIDAKADLSEGSIFIEGSGTTDSNAKTSTWLGTSDKITQYYDGLTIRYKIGVAGQSTTTLNINNLGAKTVYLFNTTKLTTQFPVKSIIHLIYHADLNSGCWICSDYDSNTNTYQRVYPSTDNVEYPITSRYNTTTGSSYYAEYGRYSTGVTLNPSTNTITATKFKGALTGNADTATKATQDASGNVITSTYETKADATTKLNNINSQISQLSSEIVDIPNNDLLLEKVAEKVPYVKVAEHPVCVNSIAEMTDTSKMYVLNSDGMFYSYKTREVATEGTKTPNFTNLMDDSKSYIKDQQRYSQTSGAFSKNDAVCGVVVPITTIAGTNKLRVRGATKDTVYQYCYSSGSLSNNTTFSGSYSGSWTTESNGDLLFTFTVGSVQSTCVTFTVVSGVNVENLIVTMNEEITYTTTAGGTQTITEWSSTGISYNQPADCENRVIANEQNIENLKGRTSSLENRLNSISINSNGTTVFSTPAYAPVPQLPADGSSTADFHGLDITTQQAYNYMDALVNKHKGYVTKQTMGKDQSGTYDHNRYILCKSYWRAWLKPNYPMMFAWINGNTIIYSVSASPRVGDNMYTTPYIGTVYSTVTAVNCSVPDATNGIAGTPSTRTVKGLVFTRHKSGDVEPTIVYTKVESSLSALNSGTVYNSAFGSLTKVTAYTKEAITCADGNTYTRYPFEDLKADKSKPLSIFILTNEHGHHGDNKVPSITLMRMAKDLCENRENPFLQWLKENAMITMIPVGNPWGYDPSAGDGGAGYNNSRGVNINRNYDTPGWAGSDNNYGDDTTFGAYAGSEVETQHIMNTMHLCKAKVGMSMHGLGLGQYKTKATEYTDGLMWQGCGFDKSRMTKVAEVLFSDYGQLIGGHTSWDQSHEYCGKSPAYIQYVGAVGGLNEIPDFETGTLDLYTPTVMEAAYTQMLLFLQTWCEEALEK